MGSAVEYQLIEFDRGQDGSVRVKRGDHCADEHEALRHVQPPLPRRRSPENAKSYRLRRIEKGVPMRLGPRFTCMRDLWTIWLREGHFPRRR